LIDFGQCAWSIKHDPESAAKTCAVADRLPQGLEKAILLLANARMRVKAGCPAEAEEALDSALKAGRSVEDVRRPFLMFIAAAELADLHSPSAPVVLRQAIKDLNSFEEAQYSTLDWTQSVQAGPLKASFPLIVSNVDFSFSKAFHRVVVSDPEDAMANAEELRSEALRAQAFVEVAAALLKRVPAAPPQNDPAILVGEDGMRKSAAKTVMPAYPAEALKKHQQGVAVVELQFDGKGEITRVAVLEAPAASINEAVAAAVKQWKFTPSKRADGRPVNIRGKLTFYFEIDKDGKGRVQNPKQFR
jgi:TonB family protein